MILQQARRAASLAGTYAFGSVCQKSLGVLLLPVYTFYLTPKDFGVVSLAYLTVTLVNQAVRSPAGSAIRRFYHHPDYQDDRGKLLCTLLVFFGLNSVIVAVLYWVSCRQLCWWLFGDLQYLKVLQCYALCALFLPLSGLLQQYLQVTERAGKHVIAGLTGTFMGAGVTIYLLAVAKAGPIAVAWGHGVDAACQALLVFGLYVRDAEWGFAPKLLNEPLKYGYGILVGGYSQTLISAGDKFVIAALMSPAAVGIYELGYKFGSLLSFLVVDAVKRGVQPVILRHEADPDGQRQMIRQFANIYYVVAMFIGLGLSLFAKECIQLLSSSDSFHSAWMVVPIVVLAYVQHGLGNFLNMGLVMAKRPWQISTNLVISALVNIGLNIVLIPIWGIIGAATATLLSYAVWNGLKAFYSARHYEVRFDWGRLTHVTIVGIVLCCAGLWSQVGLGPLISIAVKAMLLAMYPALLWFTGFFTTEERAQILQLPSQARSLPDAIASRRAA